MKLYCLNCEENGFSVQDESHAYIVYLYTHKVHWNRVWRASDPTATRNLGESLTFPIVDLNPLYFQRCELTRRRKAHICKGISY